MMDKERRYSRRKAARNIYVSLRPLDPQVWFRYWNGTECLMRDISMVGVGVVSNAKIPVGTPLSIDLKLGKTGSIIRIFGKIIWIIQEKDQYRSGVSFSWWKEDQDKKTAGSFLEHLSSVN